MSGSPKKKLPKGLREERDEFGLRGLLGNNLRTNVWVTLALAGDDGIDGSSIGARLHVQHDLPLIHRRLSEFHKAGFLRRKEYGQILYYSLDPDHPWSARLRALLLKIAEIEPNYRLGFELLPDLQPAARQALERNRKRKTAKLKQSDQILNRSHSRRKTKR